MKSRPPRLGRDYMNWGWNCWHCSTEVRLTVLLFHDNERLPLVSEWETVRRMRSQNLCAECAAAGKMGRDDEIRGSGTAEQVGQYGYKILRGHHIVQMLRGEPIDLGLMILTDPRHGPGGAWAPENGGPPEEVPVYTRESVQQAFAGWRR